MWLNLLNSTVDKTREIGIGESAVFALLGFGVVFVGIVFLIFVVWLIGKAMTKTSGNAVKDKQKQKPIKQETTVSQAIAVADAQEEISEETVAVIMATLTAYYEQTNPKCEFTVKRIKKFKEKYYA